MLKLIRFINVKSLHTTSLECGEDSNTFSFNSPPDDKVSIMKCGNKFISSKGSSENLVESSVFAIEQKTPVEL